MKEYKRQESYDMSILLKEIEVAERLRCSPSKVKRLRLSGKLAYLPGRPVLIRAEDLTAFMESAFYRVWAAEPETPSKRFLLETEVADILRCTPQRVYQLRHSGKLRYTPGRPVLIDEADLEAYIAAETRKVYPNEDELEEAMQEMARERDRQLWIKLRLWRKMSADRKGS